MNRCEIKLYESLAKLAVKQLAFIGSQLESDSGRLSKFIFVYRNSRIKRLLEKLWQCKEGANNESAGKEVMDDMDLIQADEVVWPHITETEIDYLRMIFHGMHDVLDTDSDEGPDVAAEMPQGSASVSVALPVLNRP